MRRVLLAAAIAAALAPAALAGHRRASVPPAALPAIGLMVPAALNDTANGATFVGSMHVSWYRPNAIYLDRATLTCNECGMAASLGLKLALVLMPNGSAGVPATPAMDIAKYKQQVTSVVQAFHPALIMADNEENSDVFYTGTPAQYHAELRAACEVAHTYGIACADGGLVSRGVALLVVNDYAQSGQQDKALSMAQRSLGIPNLTTFAQVQQTLAASSDQIQRCHDLVAGFAADGADYINFHWYETDAGALQEAVAFLRRNSSGRPIITDEIGQRNEDATEVTSKLATIKQLGLTFAIWFSGDGPVSRALQNPDWTLRPNGTAFQQTMAAWR